VKAGVCKTRVLFLCRGKVVDGLGGGAESEAGLYRVRWLRLSARLVSHACTNDMPSCMCIRTRAHTHTVGIWCVEDWGILVRGLEIERSRSKDAG